MELLVTRTGAQRRNVHNFVYITEAIYSWGMKARLHDICDYHIHRIPHEY